MTLQNSRANALFEVRHPRRSDVHNASNGASHDADNEDDNPGRHGIQLGPNPSPSGAPLRLVDVPMAVAVARDVLQPVDRLEVLILANAGREIVNCFAVFRS